VPELFVEGGGRRWRIGALTGTRASWEEFKLEERSKNGMRIKKQCRGTRRGTRASWGKDRPSGNSVKKTGRIK